MSVDAYERARYENDLRRVLACGDAEMVPGLGRDPEDVLAEARALLGQE